jgi:hypothetical protein
MSDSSANHGRLSSTHPIGDLVEGWHFRLNEVSAGRYEIEGCDAVGRRVYRQGNDPEALKREAALDAQEIILRRSR